jgi:hypothetical protein
MKKSILLLVLAFTIATAYTQKIQLKKGVLSKDDVQIGKVEGEATLLKGTDVAIKSVDGATTLVSIKDPLVTFGSPYHEPIRYYAIEFVTLGKKAAFIPDQKKFFTSEKKLVEYLFERIGADFLGKDGLNAATIDQFIASKDQSKAIASDTTHIGNLIRVSKVKITEPIINRPADGGVRINSLSKETISTTWQETFETFDVLKGNVVIGQITKRYKGDPSVPSTSPSSQSVEYIVKRKVPSFMLDDKKIDFISLAKIKSTVSGPDIMTYCESKYLKIGNVFAAEAEIADWLVSKGCL